jgi:plastocyanin
MLTAFAALALSSCTNPPVGGTTPPPPGPPTPPPAGGMACPATITTEAGNVYSVTSCKIKVGATLTIQGSSVHPLNVQGGGQNITKQASNATNIAFSSAGTVNVFCSNHAGMTATITVEP